MFITIYLTIGTIVAGWNTYCAVTSGESKDLLKEHLKTKTKIFFGLIGSYAFTTVFWPITTILMAWIAYEEFRSKDKEP